MPVIEFSFASLASGDLTAAVRVPDSDFKVRSLDTTPMLIALGGKRRDQLELYPHCVCAEEFEEAGLCAASLDLPNHGPRIDRYGSGIDGWCAAFMSGECDPFETCIADCRALVAACKERGFMGARGNVYVYGVSRGGYMGLRWAAADDTIAGVAAMGPCTDWRPTRWWSAVATDAAVAALAIDTWAPQLANRPVYIAIGNHDDGVHTPSAIKLATAILEREGDQSAKGTSWLELHVVETTGHTIPTQFRRAGAAWLLRQEQAATTAARL